MKQTLSIWWQLVINWRYCHPARRATPNMSTSHVMYAQPCDL